MNTQKSIAGANGSFAMNTTGIKNINFVGIDIPSSVTISILLDQDGTNVTQDYMFTVNGAIGGGYITPNNQVQYFTSITTTAGECILNLKGE